MQVSVEKDTYTIVDNFTLASPVINSLINGDLQIFQVSGLFASQVLTY
jgi:hypothetical protein